MSAAQKQETVEVARFEPRLAEAFRALNLAWIERYFVVEEMDHHQLDDPQSTVIAPGGEVFFVLESGRPVGCVAMVPEGDGVYELAKMAVDPACQGRGYSNLLMQAALDWAREKNARKVLLLSNTKLAPAIALYRKWGFTTTRLGPHPHYKRTDIEMEIDLQPGS